MFLVQRRQMINCERPLSVLSGHPSVLPCYVYSTAVTRSRKKHILVGILFKTNKPTVKQFVYSQLHAADCAHGGAGAISQEPLFFPLPTHQA